MFVVCVVLCGRARGLLTSMVCVVLCARGVCDVLVVWYARDSLARSVLVVCSMCISILCAPCVSVYYNNSSYHTVIIN